MQDFVINVAAVALVLGVMILVHEFGHYAAAKLFGVRVEVFSIGFGKRLLGFKKGDTDYRISAIPLGGYVKMSGENFSEERNGAPYEFMSHPRWQRLVIAFAGPFMNIMLAIGLLTGVYMVRYEHPVYLDKPAVIGWVLENSPAAKAGFEPGDRIVRHRWTEGSDVGRCDSPRRRQSKSAAQRRRRTKRATAGPRPSSLSHGLADRTLRSDGLPTSQISSLPWITCLMRRRLASRWATS